MPRRRRTPPNTALPTSGDPRPGTASPTSAAPFFTLAIEGPNTVVALDSFENEIVSLHFDDFNDLTSDSFREYAAEAVAAVVVSLGEMGTDKDVYRGSKQAENDVISLLDSENSENDDEIYIEDDIDEIFAAVLAENEAAHAIENLDADLALALRLQEEEEEEQEKEEKKKRRGKAGGEGGGGGAWGSSHQHHHHHHRLHPFSAPPQPPTSLPTTITATTTAVPSSSYSNIMGTVPGISTALSAHLTSTNNSYKVPDMEFPLLPPKISSAAQYNAGEILLSSSFSSSFSSSSLQQQQQQQRRVPLKTRMASERSTGVRKVTFSCGGRRTIDNDRKPEEFPVAAEDTPGNTIGNTTCNTTCNTTGNHRHGRQHSSDQISTTQFLDSYDGEAVEARATALRYLEKHQGEKKCNDGPTASASRQAIKKMMDSSNISSSCNTQKADNDDDNDHHHGGSGYSRRKIRTLVMSMIAAGWEFMPERRGSGHYIYQRFIPPTGHKQILVLPCTPSSQRSIEAVHSRLQRMDREAAAVRAAALGTEGGG